MLNTIFILSAIVGGTLVVCQFVMMFLGFGDDVSGDVDMGGDFSGNMDVGGDVGAEAPDIDHHTSWSQAADADLGHPDASRIFEILSFRSVVAAITCFGFAGKAALASDATETKALIVGLGAGAAALYGMYWVMVQIYKLRAAGNEDIRNALGQPASVYVAIPGQKNGLGKVHMKVQNRTVEYQALTEQKDTLQSGDQVVVVHVLGSDKVLVAATDKPAS